MKRPWAFICASEGATSKHLRNYCREVYLLGYLPVCPKLQDSQYPGAGRCRGTQRIYCYCAG